MTVKLRFYILLAGLFLVYACTNASRPVYAAQPTSQNEVPENQAAAVPEENTQAAKDAAPHADYQQLFLKIVYGKAELSEVLAALKQQDPAALTNVVHALYSMRWHRRVIHLLEDMWALDREKYPGLAWDELAKPPVRIALASTINRIKIFDTQEQKDYIRAHKNDEHEFIRAQVVISLGLNGDPVDVPYLKQMADGENVYVTQSAITALGIMNNNQARKVMIELEEKYRGDGRGKLLAEVLKKAYNWPAE